MNDLFKLNEPKATFSERAKGHFPSVAAIGIIAFMDA
jgi:hypothetical protein